MLGFYLSEQFSPPLPALHIIRHVILEGLETFPKLPDAYARAARSHVNDLLPSPFYVSEAEFVFLF
jgi:hypothetical protein